MRLPIMGLPAGAMGKKKYYGPEIITNGSFEIDGAGGDDVFADWDENKGTGAIEKATGAGEFYAGLASCKLTSAAGVDTLVYRTITVEAGENYHLTFYSRGDDAFGGRFRVLDLSNTANIIAVTPTGAITTDWKKLDVDFAAPAGCISIILYFYCAETTAAHPVYFDAVSLKKHI